MPTNKILLNNVVFTMIFSILLLLSIVQSFCNGDGRIPGEYIVFFADDSDKEATQERLFTHAKQQQESQPPQLLIDLRQGIAVQGLSEDVAREWENDAAVGRIVPVRIEFLKLISFFFPFVINSLTFRFYH